MRMVTAIAMHAPGMGSPLALAVDDALDVFRFVVESKRKR